MKNLVAFSKAVIFLSLIVLVETLGLTTVRYFAPASRHRLVAQVDLPTAEGSRLCQLQVQLLCDAGFVLPPRGQLVPASYCSARHGPVFSFTISHMVLVVVAIHNHHSHHYS
jgi:hypothetical protein